jgi:transposase
MTATRYPDMICLSMLDVQPVKPDGDGHPCGEPFPDDPTRAEECEDYADWEIGRVMLRTRDGMNAAEIAEDLGMNCQNVEYIKKQCALWLMGELPPRKAKKNAPVHLTLQQKEEAKRLYEEGGHSIREIAEMVGSTMGRVRYTVTGQ